MKDPNIFAILTLRGKKNLPSPANPLTKICPGPDEASRGVETLPITNGQKPASFQATLGPAHTIAVRKEQISQLDASDRIILTFANPPKDPLRGWQFGTNKKLSDVLLGNRGTNGISSQQFHINVDGKGWIWLHDDCSLHGTAVGYGDKERNEVRRVETGILSHSPGSGILWERITIHAGDLEFKVEFPNHHTGDAKYLDNIRLLSQRSKAMLSPTNSLKPLPITLSRSQYRRRGAVYVRFNHSSIGEGTFGEVYRVVNVHDGLQYAAKVFKRLKEWTDEEWKDMITREAGILWDNRHPNVMRAVDYQFTPTPRLIMPYYPDGSLQSCIESKVLKDHHHAPNLHQILLGLQYLHGEGIVHCDLKPHNILVKLDKSALSLVITDFGSSKILRESEGLLQSIWGTLYYRAPELMYWGGRDGYGAKVDIWAAGVTIGECIWDLPEAPSTPKRKDYERSPDYHDALARWYDSWVKLFFREESKERKDPSLVDIVRQHMLVVEPIDRSSAEDCLNLGYDLGLFRTDSDGNIEDNDKRSLEQSTNDNSDAKGDRTEQRPTTNQARPKRSPTRNSQARGSQKARKREATENKTGLNSQTRGKENDTDRAKTQAKGRAVEEPATKATGFTTNGRAAEVKAPDLILEAIGSLCNQGVAKGLLDLLSTC